MPRAMAPGAAAIRPTDARPAHRLGHLVLALPLLAAILFVYLFSTALPLTDEWHFLRAIISLQGADLLSRAGRASAFNLLPARFAEHWVILPFLVYWPIAEWSHFDSRYFIGITVAAFAVEALLFRRYLVTSSIWALPIFLLLFCPSHYMEFLWGWQFTLAFSIAFALAGLILIERMSVAGGGPGRLAHLALATICFWLATLSSAGGFFGFPCAVLVVALGPLHRLAKAVSTGVLTLAAVATYLIMMHAPGRRISAGLREVLYGLTALGATVWGSPVGLFTFGLDRRSVTGLVIVAAATAVVTRAVTIGALPRLALALSIMVFGLLCLASMAMTREHLGNWHLQYVLPAVCGAYAASYRLWKEDKSIFAAGPLVALLSVLMVCLFGYYKGFSEYGPHYHAYIRSIERYFQGHLQQPGQPKPFPDAWEVTPEMLLFLSWHRHPVFPQSREPGAVTSLSATARIFVRDREVVPPIDIAGGRGKPLILTVALPGPMAARRVLAQVAAWTVELRRVHPTHSDIPRCRDVAVVCYAAMIVSRALPRGQHEVRVLMGD